MLNLKDLEFFQDLSEDDGSKLSGGLGPYSGAEYYNEEGQLCKWAEWEHEMSYMDDQGHEGGYKSVGFEELCQVPAEGGGMEWRRTGKSFEL